VGEQDQVTRAQSTAYLPANKVKDAANAALRKLVAERMGVMDIVTRDHQRVSGWYRSRDWAKRTLPQGHKAIADQFRVHDERALLAIIDLASAAMRHAPDLTMDVTAEDFQLLKPFYVED
jgi:hypothetical protein